MSESSSGSERLEVQASKDTAVRLFIVAAMLIIFGAWCFYEGHIADVYEYKPFSEDINAWATWALNYYGGFVFVPPGLILAGLAIRSMSRKLVADSEKIRYGSRTVAWSDVTKLDASQLKSKQILDLEVTGDAEPLRLDGYKLQDFKEVVAFVETHVPGSAKS